MKHPTKQYKSQTSNLGWQGGEQEKDLDGKTGLSQYQILRLLEHYPL